MKEVVTKQIHFNVPEYMHTLIKREAAQKKTSITNLFIRAMLEHLIKGNDGSEELSSLQNEISSNY